MDLNKLCPHCLMQVNNISEIENCPYCGKNIKKISEVQHQLKPQTILAGKYLIGDVLGEGGFGITYVGFDLNLEMRVAIKEFYPNGYATREANATTALTVYSGQNQASVEKWRDSFIKEARSLAKCSHLSGVVGVKDFFQENNTAYIILEYLEGKTLKDYVKENGGKIPVTMLLQALEPVIVSLGEVHKSGLIHRDISPDNIMMLPGGNMKLLDFGAARDYTESGEKSLSVMLKPGYAPEEQYRSKGVQGPWSDIYALSGTIYRCITGVTPIESMERIRKDELKKPSELGIAIESSVEEALMKGLAVFSEDRYQNIEDFIKDLYKNSNQISQSNPVMTAKVEVPRDKKEAVKEPEKREESESTTNAFEPVKQVQETAKSDIKAEVNKSETLKEIFLKNKVPVLIVAAVAVIVIISVSIIGSGKNKTEETVATIGNTETANTSDAEQLVEEKIENETESSGSEVSEQSTEEEDTEAVESAEEETAEEAETTDDAVADEASTATDSSTSSESEKEKIFSKFLGFWVWENEVKEYQAGGGYNGIDIADRAGAAYMEDGARYEFQVTRGERWTDAALVSCSEKELVFEYADYYGSTKRVTLTLLDENTIEETFESESGSSTQKAVKSTSLGEPENIDANVEQIRTWYYDTQERLDSLLYASYDTNLECYFDGAYPAKVVAKSGYNNWNVTREYYYHDQKLYFVFVHGDIGEYRFYIKDGVIIRSIDAEGISVDAGYGASPEIWDISDKFFEEEEAFPLMINCGN